MTFQLLDNYNAQNLRLTPSAYYPMNERSGTTAHDLSKNGFNATLQATGVTLAQAGPIVGEAGTSMLFNGSTGWATCAAGLSTNGWSSLTLLAWFKLSNTTFANYPNIMGNDGNTAGFNVLVAPTGDGSSAYFNIFSNSAKHSLFWGTTVMASGVWNYSATTWDGSTMKWYMNGVTTPLATLAATGTIATTANALDIGNNQRDTTSFQMPGNLCNLMLIQRALTLDEIQSIWHSSKKGQIWGSTAA